MELKIYRSMIADNSLNEEKNSIGKIHILHVAMFCLDLGKLSFGGVTTGLIRRTEENTNAFQVVIKEFSFIF